MEQRTMEIAGMTCGGCVSTVKKALGALPGTSVDAVTVGSATVSYDPTRTTPAAIDQAVRDAGYEPVTAGAPVAAGAVRPAGGACCGGGDSEDENCCG